MTTSSIVRPRWLSWAWLLPALVGGGITALVMLVLPPDRTINGLGEFLFKLTPLVSAVFTIALFPRQRTWSHWFLLGAFLLYMGYLDSQLVIEIFRLMGVADQSAEVQNAQFAFFYRFAIFLNAFTVLLAVFAFRLGGGRSDHALKLGLAGILILISGLNDFTFWWMYQWPGGTRPETFDWASHVIVFTGSPPTAFGMVIFISIHLILAAVVMFLPLRRWGERLLGRWMPKEV